MPLISLFSIGVLIGRLQHLIGHLWWLLIKLGAKHIMVIEPSDESGDDLGFTDVGNLIPRF